MKLPHRRQFLHLAAGAAVLPGVSQIARARAYPSRPVRLIVGFSPGGSADVTARVIGQWLSERLGQQFVVENRPVAGGNLATEAVINAPADGHTLLLINTANAINASLYDRLTFDFIRAVAAVAGISQEPLVMEINPSVPAKTVPELIAYAKANPAKINMGSGGNGTALHVAGELFKMMAGVNMVHVPYRGGAPALTDLLSGQIQLLFGSMAFSREHIRAGRLRALAVTTPVRAEALPSVPTLAEFLPGYEASNWFGVGAPRATPASIIERLNKEINAALADAKLKARLSDMGSTVLPGSPVDFEKFITDETEKWGKVVRAANIKAE